MRWVGCQKETTDLIIEGGGNYLVALKGNQGRMYQAARDLFEDTLKNTPGVYIKPDQASSFDVAHGREEERVCYLLKDLSQLRLADCNVQSWHDLNGLVVESTTLRGGKPSSERRFYLTSANWNAEEALGTGMK